MRRWQQRRDEILTAAAPRPRTTLDDLALQPDQLQAIRSALAGQEEVVIAEIDQDGFYLSHFGPLAGLPMTDSAAFLPRRRFGVQLVARKNGVGVKKRYAGRKERFLHELYALHTLAAAGCRVPALLDVDFQDLSITSSLVPGETLRERLAQHASVMRDRDAAREPGMAHLPAAQRLAMCVENGARVVHRVVDQAFLDEIYRQLQIIHSAKVVWGDVKTGNVIIEKGTGLPWLVDFDTAIDCRRMNRFSFRALCDADIEAFNRHTGSDRWTYRRIRQHQAAHAGKLLDGPLYAPAYIGYGIRIGPIWSRGSGFGRWHYILKESLPQVAGKRILDLGANNGLTSLEMLRAGAREVVALELSDEAIRQGETLRRLYEWADNRPYPLRYAQGNMADLPDMDLGRFDMAIALCCLYYLESEDMQRVTRQVSQLAPVFVLQANHNPNLRRPSEALVQRSRIEYLEELLRSSGFGDTTVVSRRGYLRPLVIGRSHAAFERARAA
jgi:tRNA A-37 threonylcarbamoyl transferase component Bud32/SAM-dependent methyltransferase